MHPGTPQAPGRTLPTVLIVLGAIGIVGIVVFLLIARQAARPGPIPYAVTQIRVIPFGLVPPGDLEQILLVLRQDFPHIAITLDRPLPLPLAAFDRTRRQFNVDVLLMVLQRLPASASVRLVGVTNQDLFARGSSYVFATTDARRDSVVSVARLHSDDGTLSADRYRKILRRQLGFTFGFQSSHDRACVMFYAATLAELDAKGSAWCGGEADAIRSIQGQR